MAQRNPSFKLLVRIWNKKLEESGFEDHEIEIGGERALKQRASNAYRQASELERESRLAYYSLLGHMANNTEFPCRLEQLVMCMYSDGSSIKEIVEELIKQGLTDKRNRWRIRAIIRRWEVRWGLRSWSLKQMRLTKFTG